MSETEMRSVASDPSADAAAGMDNAAIQSAYQSLIRSARSLLTTRHEFARMFGFEQFGGNRDLFKVLGYPEALSYGHYKQRYERGGIAKRIVNAAPEAMGWSKLDIVEDDDPKNKTTFEQTCEDLFQRLNIGSVLERADKQAGIGEYAVIYVGVKEKGTKGNQDILAQEMSRLTGPDDIAYLRPLSQELATITEWVGDSPDDDISDERYGLPKYYNIQLSGRHRSIVGLGGPTAGTIRKVHHSRVIHITHDPLDSEVFSAPELQAAWNYLVDLDKLVGGGSEATWKEAVNRTLFDLDKDIGPDGGSLLSQAAIDPANVAAFNLSKEKLKEQLEELENNLRKYMLTRGVTPKTITGKVVQFKENAEVLKSFIAATYNIPQRNLFGSELGKASSIQDGDNWNTFKASRQNKFGVVTARKLFDCFIKYNALPKPKQYTPKWPDEEELNEPAKAALVQTLTTANMNQQKSNGEMVMSPAEIRDRVYQLDPLPPPPKPDPVVVPIAVVDPNAADPNADPNADPTIVPSVAAEHKFSSTQVDIPEPTRNVMLALGASIPDNQLSSDGREINPHITIKYGISSDNSALVALLVADYGPISFKLGKTNIFSSDEYDVVYAMVESPDLVKLNKLISDSLNVVNTHPEYVPHATIAFVKPGQGEQYKGISTLDGTNTSVSCIVFSSSDGTKTNISTEKVN